MLIRPRAVRALALGHSVAPGLLPSCSNDITRPQPCQIPPLPLRMVPHTTASGQMSLSPSPAPGPPAKLVCPASHGHVFPDRRTSPNPSTPASQPHPQPSGTPLPSQLHGSYNPQDQAGTAHTQIPTSWAKLQLWFSDFRDPFPRRSQAHLRLPLARDVPTGQRAPGHHFWPP